MIFLYIFGFFTLKVRDNLKRQRNLRYLKLPRTNTVKSKLETMQNIDFYIIFRHKSIKVVGRGWLQRPTIGFHVLFRAKCSWFGQRHLKQNITQQCCWRDFQNSLKRFVLFYVSLCVIRRWTGSLLKVEWFLREWTVGTLSSWYRVQCTICICCSWILSIVKHRTHHGNHWRQRPFPSFRIIPFRFQGFEATFSVICLVKSVKWQSR